MLSGSSSSFVPSDRSTVHGRRGRVPADAQSLPKRRHVPQHLRRLPVCVRQRLGGRRLRREHWRLRQRRLLPGLHLPRPRGLFRLRVSPRPHRFVRNTCAKEVGGRGILVKRCARGCMYQGRSVRNRGRSHDFGGKWSESWIFSISKVKNTGKKGVLNLLNFLWPSGCRKKKIIWILVHFWSGLYIYFKTASKITHTKLLGGFKYRWLASASFTSLDTWYRYLLITIWWTTFPWVM